MNLATHRPSASPLWRGMRGVTLIELMVVVVIIGILAAIAYPSYQNQVRQTRRTDGQTTLLDAAQRLERCYTRYNDYDAGGCDVATTLKSAAGIASSDGWYAITGVLGRSTFTLTATAQGDQTKDTLCGNLTLTHRGERGAEDTSCW